MTIETKTAPAAAVRPCPEGWVRYDLSAPGADFEVSVAPDTDLGGRFAAYSHDDGTMLIVNGWNVTMTLPVEGAAA